jgi:hypothetical protein
VYRARPPVALFWCRLGRGSLRNVEGMPLLTGDARLGSDEPRDAMDTQALAAVLPSSGGLVTNTTLSNTAGAASRHCLPCATVFLASLAVNHARGLCGEDCGLQGRDVMCVRRGGPGRTRGDTDMWRARAGV